MPDVTKLLAAIDDEASNAYGAEADELTADRSEAIDLYMGRLLGNEVEGRSQVVSRVVADTVEWIKPALIRIFTSDDNIVLFNPTGPEDEEGAKQETDYINYICQQKNNWFPFVYEWISDCLITRNAYAMGAWEEKPQYSIESYEGLTDDQLALIMQDQNVQIMAHAPRPEQIEVMTEQGPMAQQIGLHDVKVKRIKPYGCVKLSVLPPERCLVSSRAKSMSVRESPYFEFWDMKSISDLREMGLDVPDDISDDGGIETQEIDLARDVADTANIFERSTNLDPTMREVRVRMIWIQHDYNQDGIAELNYVIRVGRTILHLEEIEAIPVASIVPIILPHRHVGLCIADLTADLQWIHTAILRGTLDNMYLANNGRYGISNRVNLDDMLTSRPGGVVRVDTNGADTGGHIVPFVHPNVIPQALTMLEYVDQIRENRTGTNRYFTGTDLNSLNKTASGIAQLSSSAAQRVELIARVVGEGMRELFQIVHELTLKHSRVEEVIQLRNKWVSVDPRQWRKRSDMTVSVGLGVGNREQLMNNLRMIAQAQIPGLQIGVVTPQNVYNTFAELTKAAGFANPDKFWTDPSKMPPQPKGPPPEIIKAQMDNQTKLKIATEDNVVELEKQRRQIAADAMMKMAEGMQPAQ